jgi:hypothetical protein
MRQTHAKNCHFLTPQVNLTPDFGAPQPSGVTEPGHSFIFFTIKNIYL